MGNKMKIFKMNIEQSPNVPSSLGVRSIPTIMLFNNGKHIDTKIGVLQKNTLIEWINSNVTL
jgi:thioredoxin 1